MCIAILNKDGLLTRDDIGNAWNANDDGGGLLWVEDGQMKFFKLSSEGAIYSSDGDYQLEFTDDDTPATNSSVDKLHEHIDTLPCGVCTELDCGSCRFLDSVDSAYAHGYAAVMDDTPDISEELIDYFYEYYEGLRKVMDTPILLHFRITTHGFNDNGIHPHLVNENCGVIHNGILSGLGNHLKSDTVEFVEILQKYSDPNHLIFKEEKFLERFINEFGGHSKLVFLNSNNEWKIYGENLGFWEKGNWFSNSSCKNLSLTYPSYGKRSTKYYDYGWD